MDDKQEPGVPGMPCPDCGRRIVTTLDAILSGSPIVCTCGLALTVDERSSEGTLRDLRALRTRLGQQSR